MSSCPITYQSCSPEKYSAAGLKKLHRKLSTLSPLDVSSILGQPSSKFAINWNYDWAFGEIAPESQEMIISNKKSRFILIPPAKPFLQTSENIDLSTRIAQICEIDSAFHGMIYNLDQTFTFFSEIPGMTQSNRLTLTKSYDALKSLKKPLKPDSAEGIIEMIDQFCTFPVVEKYRLFQRILFSWLIGYQILSWKDFFLLHFPQKITLAPPMFFANTVLFFGRQERELTLSIQDKNSSLEAAFLTQTLGQEMLHLPQEAIDHFLNTLKIKYPAIRKLVFDSFLSEELKDQFLDVIVGRFGRLRL